MLTSINVTWKMDNETTHNATHGVLVPGHKTLFAHVSAQHLCTNSSAGMNRKVLQTHTKLLLQGATVVAQLLPMLRFLQAAVHHASKPAPPDAVPTSPTSTLNTTDATEQLATAANLAAEGMQSTGVEAGEQTEAGAYAAAAAFPVGAGAGPEADVTALPLVAVPGPLQGQDGGSEGSGLEGEDMEEEIEIEEDIGVACLLRLCSIWILITAGICFLHQIGLIHPPVNLQLHFK